MSPNKNMKTFLSVEMDFDRALKFLDYFNNKNAGQAVIGASESGISFPLKRRDLLLDYILTLMGRDEEEGFSDSNIELLHTQVCVLYWILDNMIL